MSTKKSLGETVLGWFVVREDDGGQDDDAAAKELLASVHDKGSAPRPPAPPGKGARAHAAGKAPAHGAAPVPPVPKTAVSRLPDAPVHGAPAVQLKGSEIPPVVAGATPDAKVFAQVYRAAEISEADQEGVEKALNP